MFIAAGLVFWWAVISPGRMTPGHRLGYLLIAFLAASPLALGLALAGSPVYDFYLHTPRLWGLSALEDQQIGAITMALEQAAILFAAVRDQALRQCWTRKADETEGVGFYHGH